MGLDTYTQAKQLLEEASGPLPIYHCGPVEESVVRELERTLRYALPASYRQMLLDFGSLSFGSTEFYGIQRRANDDYVQEALENTTDLLSVFEDHPDGLLLVWEMNVDWFSFWLDLKERDADGECPVLEIPQFPDNGLVHAFDDFGDCLLATVREELSAIAGD